MTDRTMVTYDQFSKRYYTRELEPQHTPGSHSYEPVSGLTTIDLHRIISEVSKRVAQTIDDKNQDLIQQVCDFLDERLP